MTRSFIAPLFAVTLLTMAVFAADAFNIEFDARADFSTFKTFALRAGTVNSPRPELDNSLFVKKLGSAIRGAVREKRLREVSTAPDLFVDYRITGEDISTVERGAGYRGNGMVIPGTGPRPLRYTQGTLVIDLVRPGESVPVWHGVYRDEEPTGSKLVESLPADAQKLIAKYPPKK